MRECLEFARDHELMDDGEREEAEKVLKALESGANLPGGCLSKQSCETYCTDVSHMEECLEFAEKAGFMSSEEIEHARRVIPLMQAGKTPGGCTSKEACENYCQDQSHFDECIAFAKEAGFITEEEAEQAKQFGGVGPGGCNSRESCETYCRAHLEECMAFGGQERNMPIPDAQNYPRPTPEQVEQYRQQYEQQSPPPTTVTPEQYQQQYQQQYQEQYQQQYQQQYESQYQEQYQQQYQEPQPQGSLKTFLRLMASVFLAF